MVGHDDAAFPVHRHAPRLAECCGSGALAVAMAPRAGPRQRGHPPPRHDLANEVVVAVRHEDVVLHVHRHSAGKLELRSGAFPVAMARDAGGAGDGRHQTVRQGDLAHAVVPVVRNNDVAIPVQRHIRWVVE
eukprot:912020-Prorocentrum_minimum.AAC.3